MAQPNNREHQVMDERALRQELCETAHQLWLRGLLPGDVGLISVELHRRRYLVTPPGRRRSRLQPNELLIVDIGGHHVNSEGGIDPTGWTPHRAAYQSSLDEIERTDVVALVQQVHATILAQPPMTMALMQLQQDRAQLKISADKTLPIVDAQDRHALRAAFSQASVVAMEDIGIMTTGADLAGALNAMECIEHAATIYLATRQPASNPVEHYDR